MVHLPNVRLYALPLRLYRGHHAFALHEGVSVAPLLVLLVMQQRWRVLPRTVGVWQTQRQLYCCFKTKDCRTNHVSGISL